MSITAHEPAELRRGVREFCATLLHDNTRPPQFVHTPEGPNMARIKALAWASSTARGALSVGGPKVGEPVEEERDRYREALREIHAITQAGMGQTS